MSAGVVILNASSLPGDAFDASLSAVESAFGLSAAVKKWHPPLEAAFDQFRRQYNSTVLLAEVLKTASEASVKRIAVVDVDLFIPVLTFVFGEAQVGGSASVVSTHRFYNQFYGMPRDDSLMMARLQKEVIHELGHNFGLYHCRHFECVMRSSTYVEEIDMKSTYPCPDCAGELASALRLKRRSG